jgi:hypothetical protein
MLLKMACMLSAAVLTVGTYGQKTGQPPVNPHIEGGSGLEAHNVLVEPVTYRGRKAVRVSDKAPTNSGDDIRSLAVVKGTSLQDGTIEIMLAGDVLPGVSPEARGFVGVAFRVSENASSYECFYLRPTNGRAEDQLRRNHSTQYISIPGYEWYTLRDKTPGKYESYVDLVPGEWTKVRIKFSGKDAQLYVNGSEQPVLVVHDLKQPVNAGAVALWVGSGTVAHFADLKVSH